MNKNQRKNRPKKKEMSEETWATQIENIKRQFENGGKEKQSQPSSENSEEK
jgi:hypothetical protein